ncbi:putative ent-kaurenoic acid monooxygenase [Helianthus anomalus]
MGLEEVGGTGFVVGILLGVMLVLKWGLKCLNTWINERDLEESKRARLPPGDMGWPLIGNMWTFLRAFKSSNPDSFISSFVDRYYTFRSL